VLFYGTDAGLVTERAAQLAKALAERDEPKGEILRLDVASLEDDPAASRRAADRTMFGVRKVCCAPNRPAAWTAAQLKPLGRGRPICRAPHRRGRQTCAPTMPCARCSRNPPASADQLLLSRRGDATSKAFIREVFAAGKMQITPEGQAPAAGAARAPTGAVAGGDRQARALCARQEHDRGERRGGAVGDAPSWLWTAS
jgi:hypothetical protein